MADIRIDRSVISENYQQDVEPQQNLGLAKEATSLPEWQGWDRVETSPLDDAARLLGIDQAPDFSTMVDQLRNTAGNESLQDLDEKRLVLDVLNNVCTKLDSVVEQNPSDNLVNFRETLSELLELYQFAYSHQLANVKG